MIPADIQDRKHCDAIIDRASRELGGIDILVNNAAHQATFEDIGDISDDEWDLSFRTNIYAMFYLTKAAVPHMKPGSAIINTASVNSDMPNPILLAYATTEGAIQNVTGGLAQMLDSKGIRANAVAPGPIWTPLIPSTMPDECSPVLCRARLGNNNRCEGRKTVHLRRYRSVFRSVSLVEVHASGTG